MSALRNPVIPIAVRWSATEASLRVENRRTLESVRPDCLARVEEACAALERRIGPTVDSLRCQPMHDSAAWQLVAQIARIAEDVTREFDVLFSVFLETDADRARAAMLVGAP